MKFCLLLDEPTDNNVKDSNNIPLFENRTAEAEVQVLFKFLDIFEKI